MKNEMSIEVIVKENPKLVQTKRVSGWGDNAHSVNVTGEIRKITISSDGESEIGIRIEEDGTITITDYSNRGYETFVPRNLTLTPRRPWTKD